MNVVVTGFVAGVLGTLAMDLLNNLVARTGLFLKIDVAMIGRMAAGWTHGRFRYGHPDEMEQVPQRDDLRLPRALRHRHWSRGPIRNRLGSLGRRYCVTDMGRPILCCDDRGLLLLRIPFDGTRSVWQEVA
jgi:uncharacterized membrane protein YeaQ/YmgE (transglycosylase-associated protein family)